MNRKVLEFLRDIASGKPAAQKRKQTRKAKAESNRRSEGDEAKPKKAPRAKKVKPEESETAS